MVWVWCCSMLWYNIKPCCAVLCRAVLCCVGHDR